MSFTEVFGGNTIYPAEPEYLALALAVDTTLQWPLEQNVGTLPVLAKIVDVTPSDEGLSVILPDATEGSNGYAVTFYNAGADTFTVKDSTGGTVATVASGDAWNIYLTDNSIPAGEWRTFQMGAGTSTANAADLAGAGLKAISTTLNQDYVTVDHAVNYPIVEADRALVQAWTGGGAGVFTLPDPAAVGEGWFVPIKNNGSGSVTVAASSGTVDGSASVILATLESAFFISDGANFYSLGLGQEVNSVFDFVSINIGGTGDYTLSGAQLNRVAYQLTGVLTGNRNLIVPASVQQYWIDNSTTGAFSLTVKTAAGSGEAVIQGSRNILYCDGTNVTTAVTFSGQTFASGSAASPGIAFTDNPTTGLFNSAGALGLATNGVQRGIASTNGNWTLAAPSSGTNPTLTVSGATAAVGVLAVTSGFSMAAASPGLMIRSTAAGGFATLSICGDSNTPGTDDFALFQNGANDNATIINRSASSGAGISLTTSAGVNSPINMNPNGVNAASFNGGAGGGNAIIGVSGNADAIGFRTLTQTTIGAAGGASALPATPLGYMTVTVNAASVKIPYYNP